MTLDHFLLTRFNLQTGGVEARVRAGDGWLTHRWELFERYCAPSVARQSTDAFTWLIYFDPESPDWLKRAIAPYAERGAFRPVFRAEVHPSDLLADIRAAGGGAGILLTTNLDNDDGIATDFLERLQRAVDFSDRRALFVVNGLIAAPNGVYLRHDARNAFCSVAAPWSDPSTSWDEWHIMLDRTMPVVELGGAPGWLQVVHGENVSNRVRGRLVSAARWEPLFPGVFATRQPPSAAQVVRDRLVGVPIRSVRDSGRTLLRRVALAVLGKDGMLGLKARLRR